MKRPPPRPRALNADVPRDLEAICVKSLTKDPADRYASAKDLAEDLSRFLRGDSILAQRRGALDRLLGWARRRPTSPA